MVTRSLGSAEELYNAWKKKQEEDEVCRHILFVKDAFKWSEVLEMLDDKVSCVLMPKDVVARFSKYIHTCVLLVDDADTLDMTNYKLSLACATYYILIWVADSMNFVKEECDKFVDEPTLKMKAQLAYELKPAQILVLPLVEIKEKFVCLGIPIPSEEVVLCKKRECMKYFLSVGKSIPPFIVQPYVNLEKMWKKFTRENKIYKNLRSIVGDDKLEICKKELKDLARKEFKGILVVTEVPMNVFEGLYLTFGKEMGIHVYSSREFDSSSLPFFKTSSFLKSVKQSIREGKKEGRVQVLIISRQDAASLDFTDMESIIVTFKPRDDTERLKIIGRVSRFGEREKVSSVLPVRYVVYEEEDWHEPMVEEIDIFQLTTFCIPGFRYLCSQK